MTEMTEEEKKAQDAIKAQEKNESKEQAEAAAKEKADKERKEKEDKSFEDKMERWRESRREHGLSEAAIDIEEERLREKRMREIVQG